MKKRVVAFAFILAALVALALAGCGNTQASSSAAASGSSEAASASAESASAQAESASASGQAASSDAAESTVPQLEFNGVPKASFQPVNNFNEPGEMTDAEVEKADRAIRAYEPKQESLLINKAKSFFYHDQLASSTKSLYDGLMSLLEDPTTNEHVVAVTLASAADQKQLADDFYLAMFAIQYDHPEFFWMYNGIETEIVAKVNPTGDKVYFFLEKPYKNYEKEMKAFNEAVDKFLADIDMNAPDNEKALAIHDKLCALVSYDDDVAAKAGKGSDLAHTAYGVFVANGSGDAHKAVCDGYSLAYEYLLQQVGIEATVMVGEGGTKDNSGPHAWSLVKLDGDWYEVDSTWDDAMTDWNDALDKAKKEDPNNEALPYYEKALNDKKYYDIITHYQYNLTTKQFSDYTPPEECTYKFDDAELTIPQPCSHKRACDLQGYEYYDTLTKLAPEATGTKYAYSAK